MLICSPFSHRQDSKLQIFLFLFSLCSLSVVLCDEVESTADSCHRYCHATSAEFYRHKKSLGEGDALRCRKIVVACQNFEHWFIAEGMLWCITQTLPQSLFSPEKELKTYIAI